MTFKVDGDNGLIFPDNSVQSTASYPSFRNRIIGGDMRLNQRVNTSGSTTSFFPVDRWFLGAAQSGKITVSQDTLAPAGHVNSIKATVSSAYTPAASEAFGLCQRIEGIHMPDVSFGSASAKYVTHSFMVRSSLTGAYSGSLRNGAVNRSHVFTYSVNAPNTWEYKIVIIPGDTSGTWATDNTEWGSVWFDLGSGANFNGAAGTWSAGNFVRAAGTVSFVGNAGATFNLAAVQLEPGAIATPFDRRPLGMELLLSQRYYQTVTFDLEGYAGAVQTRISVPMMLRTPMRVVPVRTRIFTGSSTNIRGSDPATYVTMQRMTTDSVTISAESAAVGLVQAMGFQDALSAEL